MQKEDLTHNPDVYIQIDNTQFGTLKSILKSESKVLATILQDCPDQQVYELQVSKTITLNGARHVLRFLSTPEFVKYDIPLANLHEVYAFAFQYDISKLINVCVKLQDDTIISFNAIDVYDELKHPELEKLIDKYINNSSREDCSKFLERASNIGKKFVFTSLLNKIDKLTIENNKLKDNIVTKPLSFSIPNSSSITVPYYNNYGSDITYTIAVYK
jgi:hypothetical protein